VPTVSAHLRSPLRRLHVRNITKRQRYLKLPLNVAVSVVEDTDVDGKLLVVVVVASVDVENMVVFEAATNTGDTLTKLVPMVNTEDR